MLRFLLKLAVSAALLTLWLHGRDLGDVGRQIASVERGALAAAAICYWCVALPSALRWSKVVAALDHSLPFGPSLLFVLIGYFFNQTLVSSVGGDGMRMWKAYRFGLPGDVAVVGVLLDRALQYLSHIMIVAAAFPATIALIGDWRIEAGVAALVIGSLCGIAVAAFADRIPLALARYRPLAALAPLARGLRRIFGTPRVLAVGLGLGLLNQLGGLTTIALLAHGLGLPITLLDCIVIVPVALIATALPVSIGGWGIREGAFVAGFGLIGIAASDALSLSLLFGFLNLAVRLPGGLLWLATRDAPAAAADRP